MLSVLSPYLVFDFSKPRLRVSMDGRKFESWNKHDIAYLLARIDPLFVYAIYDCFTSYQLKDKLKCRLQDLNEAGRSNVLIWI